MFDLLTNVLRSFIITVFFRVKLMAKTVYVWECRVWDGEEEEWVDYYYHTLTRDVQVARNFLFEDEGDKIDYTIDLDEELPYDKWLSNYGDTQLIRDK